MSMPPTGKLYYGDPRPAQPEPVNRNGLPIEAGRKVLPSCWVPGHAERMQAHTRRVQRDLEAIERNREQIGIHTKGVE